MPGSPTRKRKRSSPSRSPRRSPPSPPSPFSAMSPINQHALQRRADKIASRFSADQAALLLKKEKGQLTNAEEHRLKTIAPRLKRYFEIHRPEVLNFSEYSTHVPMGIPLSPQNGINVDDLILPPVLPQLSPTRSANKNKNNNGFASKATKRRKGSKKN